MLGYMGDAPAVMNITGGLYQESHISVGNGIVVGCGSSFTGRATGGTATLNIGGGPALATVDITTGAVSGFVALGLGDTGTGIVNLGTNGVLKSGSVIGGGVIGQKGTGIFNFHGGTLNLGAASLPSGATTAMEGLDHAYIYSEGAIIDTNGMDATIAQNLESPGGSGIKKIDVGSGGGSGYLGAPVVTISGGTGSGATAVAVMNGDKIDHIAITNPGNGYDSADVLTVTLSGGGYSDPGDGFHRNREQLLRRECRRRTQKDRRRCADANRCVDLRRQYDGKRRHVERHRSQHSVGHRNGEGWRDTECRFDHRRHVDHRRRSRDGSRRRSRTRYAGASGDSDPGRNRHGVAQKKIVNEID